MEPIAELRKPPVLRRWPTFVGGPEDGGVVPGLAFQKLRWVVTRPTEALNVYDPSVKLTDSVPISNEVYRREAIMFAGSRQQLVVMIHESLSNDDAGGQVWDALLAAVVPAGEA